MHNPRSKAANNHEIRQMKKISESFDRAKTTANNDLCREEAQIRKHLAQLKKEKEESKAGLSAYKDFLRGQDNFGSEEMKRVQELSNLYQHDLQDMLQHCKYQESDKKDKHENFNDSQNQLAHNRQQRRMTIRHLHEIHETDEGGHLVNSQLPLIRRAGAPRISNTGLPPTGRRASLVRPSLQVAMENGRILEQRFDNSSRFGSNPQGTTSTKRPTYYSNKDNLAREYKEAWLENNKFGDRKPNNKSSAPRFYTLHPNPASYQSRVKSILQYYDNGNLDRCKESMNLEMDNGGRRGSINSNTFNQTNGRRHTINEMINADFVGKQNRRASLPPSTAIGGYNASRRLSVDQRSVPLSRTTARKSIQSDEGDMQKFLSKYGRQQTEHATSQGPSNAAQQRRRSSLFADPVADEIQMKSIQAYQGLLSEAHRHPSDTSVPGSPNPESHKYDKLREVLQTLPSSRAVAIDPMSALQCRYLRLQPGTVDELEQLCVLMGEDPGVHAHMTEQDVIDFYA